MLFNQYLIKTLNECIVFIRSLCAVLKFVVIFIAVAGGGAWSQSPTGTSSEGTSQVLGRLPGLPLYSDRCAILWALTGTAQDNCYAPTVSGQTLRSLHLGSDDTREGIHKGEQGYFVHFEFNSSTLPPQMIQHMTQLSDLLSTELATLCVKLVGHTDTVGSAQYNQTLSVDRAQAVRLFLAGPGEIHPARLKLEGAGEAYPLPGMPGSAAENRRVEIMARPMSAGLCP